MSRRRPRLLRSVARISLIGLLVLNGWLVLLNLDKHDRLPFDVGAVPGLEAVLPDGEPGGGADGADAEVVLGTDPTLMVDETSSVRGGETESLDDVWPGGRGPVPSDPPVPRRVALTPTGDLRVTGSAPSWSVVTELAGMLAGRSGLGPLGVITRDVEWHPDASSRLDDGVVALEEPILYEPGAIGLPDAAAPGLRPAVDLVLGRPELYLVVVAHVDDLGDTEANVAVASARASAVADELVGQGVERSRVVVVVAAPDPNAPVGDDEATRRHNRRVEVRIENLLVPASAG